MKPISDAGSTPAGSTKRLAYVLHVPHQQTGRNTSPRGLALPMPGASIQGTDLALAPLRHGAISPGNPEEKLSA